MTEAIELEYSSYSNQVVNSSGSVAAWSSLVTMKTSCTFDVTYFPYDKHTCEMNLAQWISRGGDYKLGSFLN